MHAVALAQTVAPNAYLNINGINVVSNNANGSATVPNICQIHAYTVSGSPRALSSGTTASLFIGGLDGGNQCTFLQPNGNYLTYSVPETAVPMSGNTANIPEDVYVKDIAGTITISQTAWTNSTTPPTRAKDSLNRWVKNGDATSLLVCAYNPHSATTTEDDTSASDVSNVLTPLSKSLVATDTVQYLNTTSWAPVNGTTLGVHCFQYLQAVTNNQAIAINSFAIAQNTGSAGSALLGIGINSTTTTTIYTVTTCATSGYFYPLTTTGGTLGTVGITSVQRLGKGTNTNTVFSATANAYPMIMTASLTN